MVIESLLESLFCTTTAFCRFLLGQRFLIFYFLNIKTISIYEIDMPPNSQSKETHINNHSIKIWIECKICVYHYFKAIWGENHTNLNVCYLYKWHHFTNDINLCSWYKLTKMISFFKWHILKQMNTRDFVPLFWNNTRKKMLVVH